MQTRWKVTVLTLVITIVAFMFGGGSPGGEMLWGSVWPFEKPETAIEPTGAQIPLLMVIGVFEGLSLGLAVSFLIWGLPLARRVAGESLPRAVGLVLAVSWLLGNWWVHDNLHIANGENMWGLITIEYAFHVTLILAGAYTAWVVSGLLAQRARPAPA